MVHVALSARFGSNREGGVTFLVSEPGYGSTWIVVTRTRDIYRLHVFDWVNKGCIAYIQEWIGSNNNVRSSYLGRNGI